MSEELSMSDFVRTLKETMQEDFQGAEQEGFNIAMKIMQKWADHDGGDWEILMTDLAETSAGISAKPMAFGFNAATSAFQGAIIALEYAGAIE